MSPLAWIRRKRAVSHWRTKALRFVVKAFHVRDTPAEEMYLSAAQRCFHRADRHRKGDLS